MVPPARRRRTTPQNGDVAPRLSLAVVVARHHGDAFGIGEQRRQGPRAAWNSVGNAVVVRSPVTGGGPAPARCDAPTTSLRAPIGIFVPAARPS